MTDTHRWREAHPEAYGYKAVEVSTEERQGEVAVWMGGTRSSSFENVSVGPDRPSNQGWGSKRCQGPVAEWPSNGTWSGNWESRTDKKP